VIGGLSVGEPAEDMYAMTGTSGRIFCQKTNPVTLRAWVPEHPGMHRAWYRHVRLCIAHAGMPGTVSAVYVPPGRYCQYQKFKMELDLGPIDPTVRFRLVLLHSRAYLRHLFCEW